MKLVAEHAATQPRLAAVELPLLPNEVGGLSLLEDRLHAKILQIRLLRRDTQLIALTHELVLDVVEDQLAGLFLNKAPAPGSQLDQRILQGTLLALTSHQEKMIHTSSPGLLRLEITFHYLQSQTTRTFVQTEAKALWKTRIRDSLDVHDLVDNESQLLIHLIPIRLQQLLIAVMKVGYPFPQSRRMRIWDNR